MISSIVARNPSSRRLAASIWARSVSSPLVQEITIHNNSATISACSFGRVQSFSSKPSLAQLVKQLRASTGAPMVECKKALSSEDVNGDLEKAIQWLRQHGSAKVSTKMKANGREAMEGLVGLVVKEENGNTVGASLVKIGSETDFASRSEVFAKLVEDLASAALTSTTLDVNEDSDFWSTKLPENNDRTVKQAMEEAILSIRENLQLKEMHCIIPQIDESSMNVVAGYVHGKAPHSQHAGTSAAVVELQATSSDSKLSQEDLQEIGKKLAMHIVAAKPEYLSPNDVPSDILDKEKEIIIQQVCFIL